VVSVGSTPTAHFAAKLDGVTEVRAGVFVFFDLVMAGIGVCRVEDIALSVLATVNGHRADKGWTLIDAGWMALSRDRGTAKQPIDQGYGLVCDLDGRPIPDLIVADAHQEHGIIVHRSGGKAPALPVGTRVRILPNHACATGAQHGAYHVVEGGAAVTAEWPRFGGW
jgi:D-serine deaminase-like pyridoxal phosphate-dependent protein